MGQILRAKMRPITTFILAAAMLKVSLFYGSQNSAMRHHTIQRPMQRPSVVLADHRLEYSIAFSNISELKLSSRKTRYRMGELLSLDAALINSSDKPIYLTELRDLSFSARNIAGNKVGVANYVEISSDVSPDSFQLVQAGEMITHTVHILVGCDKRVLKNTQLMLDAKDDRSIFDRNLFVSWGQGCLDAKRVGTYKLTAELTNDYVVVSSEFGNLRTAVGSITSNPLTIIISK